MKKSELQKFKKKLAAEKRLIQSKRRVKEFDVEHTKGDEIDEANALASMELSIRFTERDTALVRKIDYALSKIGAGTYGECESCGDPIGLKRLEVRPTASLCIKCKEAQERTEKAFA